MNGIFVRIDYLMDAMEEKALLLKREAEPGGRDSRPKTVALRSSSNAGTFWEYYINGAEREARIFSDDTSSHVLNKEVSFYLYDHLGNTRVVYQVDGYLDSVITINNIDFVADYFPYGKIVRKYVNGQEERFLTTQHERDEETGLDYRGARYYDSDVARFLSLDPLAADFASWSPYNYVLGNPCVLIDENGKYPIHPWYNKPIIPSLYYAGMIHYDMNKSNKDKTLFEMASPWSPRELDEPGGIWSGASMAKTDKALTLTTDHSRRLLSKLYNLDYGEFTSSCAPCDGEWRSAASSGTYVYIDDENAENTFTGWNRSSFEIIGVTDNIVTDVTHLSRDPSQDHNKFMVASHDHYDVKKTLKSTVVSYNWGFFKSEHKVQFYEVNVTKTSTYYKDGKISETTSETKTYNILK